MGNRFRASIWHSGAEKKDQIGPDWGGPVEPQAETLPGLERILPMFELYVDIRDFT
jgi:hypothetical protein